MRKNRKYSKLMIWIMCVFFAVFFAVSYATRSDEKIQAQRLKIIENCKLKQVEATSFDRKNGILTVVKRFGDGYQERSRYCLSLLPALNAGKARSGKMFEISAADGRTVAFDLNGNAWIVAGSAE